MMIRRGAVEIDELREMVQVLAGQVDGMRRESEALRTGSQRSSDEIDRLKRLPPRPAFAPSGMEKASAAPTQPPATPGRRGATPDRATRGHINKASPQPDSRFKGYATLFTRELTSLADVITYLRLHARRRTCFGFRTSHK